MNDFAAACFIVFLTMLSTALIVADNVMNNSEAATSVYTETYNSR
jgi:hypothetical protein